MKICIVVASEGKNLELAHKFEEVLTQKNVDTFLINIVDLDLPLFSSRTEKNFDLASFAQTLKEKFNVQGFVFVSPEYNGGNPPALANFVAWTSRSTKDWRAHFNNRPAVIATHSSAGGHNVLTNMRLQLSYLGMNILGRQIHTTLQKPLDPQALEVVCTQLIEHARMKS